MPSGSGNRSIGVGTYISKAHIREDLPLPPLIEWTWSLACPTLVSGSIRARPTEPSQSNRQKAWAPLICRANRIVVPTTNDSHAGNILDTCREADFVDAKCVGPKGTKE